MAVEAGKGGGDREVVSIAVGLIRALVSVVRRNQGPAAEDATS